MKKINEKIVGSSIVEAIPQDPPCPLGCPECFYNRDPQPKYLPSDDEARGKIVRVNSGNDSNVDREMVIEATKHYRHKFYNTSVPRFDFPGPVVFTCNARSARYAAITRNLMAVRLLANTWNLEEQKDLALYYARAGVPILVTFMRYWTHVPEFPDDYYYAKHIRNSYWCLRPEKKIDIMTTLYKHLYLNCGRSFVLKMCGTPWSEKCLACRNCEYLYWRWFHAQKAAN